MLRTCAALLLAAACSAGDAITIWWAQWEPATGLQQLGDAFTKETGIAVNVHQIPWGSYQDQVFLDFGNARTSFDIVVGDSQWIGRGATKGLYLDLTGWLPGAVDLTTVHPKALRYLCEYPAGSGKYFAAPCETDAVGFAYRRDWFADAKEQAAFQARFGRALAVPKSWDELRDIAAFFQRPAEKRYGVALLTGRGYDSLVMGFQQVMWAWGGSWGDPTTFAVKGRLDAKPSVDALAFFKGLCASTPNGGVNFDYGQCLEAFTNGSTAMAMNYFAFAPGIDQAMGAKAGFFAVPAAKDGKRAISLGGQGFSISTKVPAAQQELAKRFIAWFLRKEQQLQWIRKPAGFTANTEILASPEFAALTPYNAPFAQSLDHLQDFWNVPVYNELLSAAQKRIGEALDGADPAASLSKLAAEHEEILEEAGLKQ